MVGKILCILGTWLFCDGIFSLHAYWGKEGVREHYIRVVRVIVGIMIVAIGLWG